MCGINGIASINPVAERNWLSKGLEVIAHRGPDDKGEWWSEDGRVGLGHRRLSILDLSPFAGQPMHDSAGNLTITFNGEIYNYLELRTELSLKGYNFQSNSDTEVLMASYAAWGENCLTRLNGMFAFAIFNRNEQRIFLARDRAGEKPLFYSLSNDTLRFASELKALLTDPKSPRYIDTDSLDCYLKMGFIPGDRCLLKGYNKLSPAHAMTYSIQSGAINVWRYWSPPDFHKEHVVEANYESELLGELEALLEDAVGKQLMADVPIGVLLSGGVDSSIITALSARHSKVRTFTIGFPGHGTMDETSHARLIAEHFNTEHTELMAEPKAAADIITFLAHQFDEPMSDTSMIPTWMVSSLVSKYCKVVLGGDGGDELFGGYPHYNRLLFLKKYSSLIPNIVRHYIAKGAAELIPEVMTKKNIRSWIMLFNTDFENDMPLITSHFDIKTRNKLMGNFPTYTPQAEKIFNAYVPSQTDLIQRITRMDFATYLVDDILVKVDRASMLNSLEVRAPFLDFKVMEFAFGQVPGHLKVTINARKILLKRLATKLLPPDFDLKRKQGFSIPLNNWLQKGPVRDMFWDILGAPEVFFDKATTQELLSNQDRGFNNGERLFALVQFELWRRHYGASIP